MFKIFDNIALCSFSDPFEAIKMSSIYQLVKECLSKKNPSPSGIRLAYRPVRKIPLKIYRSRWFRPPQY